MSEDSAREHNESGQFAAEYSEEDVMDVFDEVRGPAILSSDVEQSLGCALETARQKLLSLQAQGRVGRRKAGGRSLWWRTDDEGDSDE